jgi:hypothetical protein
LSSWCRRSRNFTSQAFSPILATLIKWL